MIYFNVKGGMAFLVQLLMVIVIRYFSIFHSPIMMEMNETKLIIKSRGFLIAASITLVLLEVISDPEFSHGPMFNFLVTGDFNPTGRPMRLWSFPAIMSVDFILMIALQLRVEYDKRHVFAQRQVSNSDEAFIYDMGTIRAIIGLGGTCLIIVMLTPWNYSDENAVQIRTLVLRALAVNVIPIIFIYRNRNMTKILVSKLAIWLSDDQPNVKNSV